MIMPDIELIILYIFFLHFIFYFLFPRFPDLFNLFKMFFLYFLRVPIGKATVFHATLFNFPVQSSQQL